MICDEKFEEKLEKDFAVVYFPTEKIYSEVPVSWLTLDKTQCWWPNSLNPRNRMIRGDKPNNPDDDGTTWILYDVKFETYASTLESARKKAEQPDYVTGNESIPLGRRQKKNKNYDSSSSNDSLTPPPSPIGSQKPKNKTKPTKTYLKKFRLK